MFGRLKLVLGSILAVTPLVVLTAQHIKLEAAAAPNERQVELPIAHRNAPVVVTKVTLGDVVVQAGRFARPRPTIDPTTRFQADDDWVQNLTINLFNRTDETIVYARITLIFPETGDGRTRPWRVYNLNLGRMPESAALDGTGKHFDQPPGSIPLSFGPSQTMAVALSGYIDKIRSGVQSAIPLATATRLKIDLNDFLFADGMRWAAGGFSDPDPQRPGKWKPRGAFFPGDTGANWPGLPGWADR